MFWLLFSTSAIIGLIIRAPAFAQFFLRHRVQLLCVGHQAHTSLHPPRHTVLSSVGTAHKHLWLRKTDPTRKSSLHNAAMGARVPCHQKCQYLRSKVPLLSDSGRQDTSGNCGALNHDTIEPRTRVIHEPQYRDTTRCYYFCIDSTCLFAMVAWHTQLSYPSEPLSKTRETNSGRRYPDV